MYNDITCIMTKHSKFVCDVCVFLGAITNRSQNKAELLAIARSLCGEPLSGGCEGGRTHNYLATALTLQVQPDRASM